MSAHKNGKKRARFVAQSVTNDHSPVGGTAVRSKPDRKKKKETRCKTDIQKPDAPNRREIFLHTKQTRVSVFRAGRHWLYFHVTYKLPSAPNLLRHKNRAPKRALKPSQHTFYQTLQNALEKQ